MLTIIDYNSDAIHDNGTECYNVVPVTYDAADKFDDITKFSKKLEAYIITRNKIIYCFKLSSKSQVKHT